MIRVRRPRKIPEVLKTKGVRERKKLIRARANGETMFAFDRGIYAHPSVKQSLADAQHAKCCFCESKVTHVGYGHVEHYRPKGGFRQSGSAKLEQPGYFWLAYEWENLLFACEVCNSRFKGNLFPIGKAKARARAPAHELKNEAPIFIDPSHEDPGKFMAFREEYPYAIKGNRRGEATWKALGLDREALAERRRDHLVSIKALIYVRDHAPSPAKRQEAAALLRAFESDAGQWAAMVRAALGKK